MKEQKKEVVSTTPGPMLFWVISGKNAYQTFLMFMLLVTSVPLILGQAEKSNLISQVWGGIIFVSAFVSLLGVYWRGSLLTGLRLELLACVTLGPSSGAIAIATAVINHSINTGLVLALALAIAAAGRFWQIISAFKQILSFKKEIASSTELK